MERNCLKTEQITAEKLETAKELASALWALRDIQNLIENYTYDLGGKNAHHNA